MSDLVIKDIDLPLYKYGLIHRHNINNYLKSKKIIYIQNCKIFILMIWMIISSLRWFIFSMEFSNGNIPLIDNDAIRYFGGITEYFNITAFIAAIMCTRITYLFNYSNASHYKWLDIIKAIKGLQTMESIGFYDKNE